MIVLLARPSCHSTILLFMRSIFGPAALPLPLLLLLLLLLLTSAAGAPAAGKKDKKRDEKSCDVCLDVINSIISQGMPDVKARPKEERVEAAKTAIVMHCSHQNHLHTSERRMCSYLEPLQTVAANALVMKMRSDRICKKLNKANPDVCELVTITKQEQSAAAMRKNNAKALSAEQYLLTVDPDFLGTMTFQQKNELKFNFERGIELI